jgi:glutamate:Na+ symporter, ESS family
MTAIHAPGLLTLTIAILVFFAGAGLNRLIEPLRRWNIPEPVTGGLIAAAATLFAYVALGVEISFSLDARDICSSISSLASASTPGSTISFRAAARSSSCWL